ncbi:MAG: hypothetical protein ZNDK_1118 [Candidatus Desulfovibrio kirbyi]|jgi:hypothetical protein|uniref:Uncharacterized protein n=1 Tax=Candidatus Desulfovibrio kirbyi TaxID=2696086 RepID=A0A6L2R789_9BACT|nr:MAG: hypothetical protein ZNDK_1118 [Candidatus Desulfovibrio kirbyi]
MKKDVHIFEEKAREFISLTLAICEQELSAVKTQPTPPQKALAAAALSVQESVKTFLAVTNIPEETD